MEDDKSRKEKLETLENEARTFRAEEESFLSGMKVESSLWIEDWARKWRKEFEPISLYAIKDFMKEAEQTNEVIQTSKPEKAKEPMLTNRPVAEHEGKHKMPVGASKTEQG